MEYGAIQYIDQPVSRLVFGTAQPILFAATRADHGEEPGFGAALEAAFELLDTVYARGINCFDCARLYGEEPLGEWIKGRGLAGRVVVLTKGAHHNAWRKRVTDYDILSDAHDSLAKLGACIDLYLLHRDDPSVPVGPIVEALNRLRDEGKVRAFGGSNWTRARIEEANEYALKHRMQPFTVSSPNYSLAAQVKDPWGGGCVTLGGPENARERAWYEQNHMPVFAYSAMARGFFSGRVKADDPETAQKYMDAFGIEGFCYPENFERLRRAEKLAAEKGASVSEIAVAWLLCQPTETYAVISTANIKHLDSNLRALSIKLTPQECAWLDLRG